MIFKAINLREIQEEKTLDRINAMSEEERREYRMVFEGKVLVETSHSNDTVSSENSDYNKLLESIMDDSDKEESSLANIFKISEENQREITQIDIEILKYFLSKKVREEFMGDMYELVEQMENEERKKRFIWFVILLQYVFVMLGQIKSIFQFNVNKEISNK